VGVTRDAALAVMAREQVTFARSEWRGTGSHPITLADDRSAQRSCVAMCYIARRRRPRW
jgi:hypothetical protein